jgi:Kef-type K+ transport system membrane component KefB
MMLAIYTLEPSQVLYYTPHILCVAAIGMVADRAPIESLISFLKAKGYGVELVQQAAIVASGCAIVVFGIIFCLFKPASDLIPSLAFSPWQSILFWIGIHIAMGLLLGAIFALFLVADYDDEKILTIVIGMVIFTSGVAFYMKLSPIFVCFALGLTFTHICQQNLHVLKMLDSIERPLYIAMYFFLGASLSFSVAWWAVLLVIPYFILRRIGRDIGGVAARQMSDASRQIPLIGRALWAPGALSAAMALNFISVYRDYEYADEIFVALIVVILLSEPLAYRFIRIWLIDATDVALVRERGEE